MCSVLKLELKKAFKNKFFWISVVLGCLITLLSFEHMVNMYKLIQVRSLLMLR